jgi:hypothetical protein
MDYQKHYDKLIERARNRELSGYKENHHIIPRCFDGTDDAENIIGLTAEEHFVAHQLLVKIYPGNHKLISALSKMLSVSSKYKGNRNNKWYGWIRKRYSESISGENNSSAKFTKEQVLEIYYSIESLDVLAERYNANRYNIITIKRKIYYRNITKDIEELPGFCMVDNKKCRLPIPIDCIEKIFYDTGGYQYFWEKYRATEAVVKSIKNKKSFKKITSKLGIPGQVKRYGMTRDMVEGVYNAKGTNTQIAERYGIHYNTVRNIKGKGSRAFNIWEEF